MLRRVYWCLLVFVGVCVLCVLLTPWVIERRYTMDSFVKNARLDGPPQVNIGGGPVTYGEAGTPRVRPDWLALRDFRDYRTVFIYRDSALGPSACAPINMPEPEGGYLDRAGSVQPEDGYSLDRWTGGLLASCALQPGAYVVVTEYRVPVLAGWFHVTFDLVSNVFEVTP